MHPFGHDKNKALSLVVMKTKLNVKEARWKVSVLKTIWKSLLVNERSNEITTQRVTKLSLPFRVITVDEFLGQYSDDTEPPAWVKRQREDFHKQFDRNKDGKMDREEARTWVLPENVHDTHDETFHLMDGSDENADGFLSVDEILLHWNLFVGSKATDHGRTLRKVRPHEEL